MKHSDIPSNYIGKLFHSNFITYISHVLLGLLVIVCLLSESKAHSPDGEDDVLTFAEEMPEIVGGIEELYKHLRYPRQAVDTGTEGRVVVQFIIDEEGQVHDPEILRDIGSGCGHAAVEAVKEIEFTPAKQNGRPVRIRYSLPISFRLN